MGGVDERLRGLLDKWRAASPHQVLEVGPDADAAEIRAAFLLLTKRYHPNRFACEAAAVRDLANEVYLVIRKAYEQLGTVAARAGRPIEGPAPAGAHDVGVASARPEEGVGHAPTVRFGSLPKVLPPPGLAEEAVTFRPAGRMKEPIASNHGAQPIAAAGPSAATATARTTPPTSRPATAGSSAGGGIAGGRGCSSATDKPIAPTRTGIPVHARTAIGSSATTAPAKAAAPVPATCHPGTTRSPEEIARILEEAKTRGHRFDSAVRLLAKGDCHAACDILLKLASEDPNSIRYRAYLACAKGMEYRAAGDVEHAVRELERAVGLDPECGLAAEALQHTQAQKRSILSKLFGH